MLVLDRKKGQAILIGDGIRVVIIRTNGQRTRLAIEAPDDVKILREELAEIPVPPKPFPPESR